MTLKTRVVHTELVVALADVEAGGVALVSGYIGGAQYSASRLHVQS